MTNDGKTARMEDRKLNRTSSSLHVTVPVYTAEPYGKVCGLVTVYGGYNVSWPVMVVFTWIVFVAE